jgi:hypothetical protein
VAGAIFMKVNTLGLFLTKNRMKTFLSPKKYPLGAIWGGVKGEYGQKKIMVV